MKTVTVSMPLFVHLPRKTMPDKKYIINKNGERNWNRFVYKKIKDKYCEIARPKIKGLIFGLPLKLTFTLWKAQNRGMDRMNPLSVHCKFFEDALVHCECIEDDDDAFTHSHHFYTGGIDRENPRVDIKMQEVEV
jgi:Holliday junction resolvase RusA-like endonuclease